MIERGDGAGLALEPVGERPPRNLDGDRASEARIACAIHLSHAARAQRSLDLIRSQTLSSRQLHRLPSPPAGLGEAFEQPDVMPRNAHRRSEALAIGMQTETCHLRR